MSDLCSASNSRFRATACLLLTLSACSSTHAPSLTSLHSSGVPTQAALTHDESVPLVKLAPRSQVEAHGQKWMISTQGKYSTQIADQILKDGGSLIDAAVAASFAIGVERPQSTGLGGGGFMIYHEARTGKNFVLDFRERAPLKATRTIYLDQIGKVIPKKSETGSLAIGVPGLVRGLKLAHSRWGKLDWAKVVKPASDLALKGFPIYPALKRAMTEERENLELFKESKKIFLDPKGRERALGEVLVQKNLAKTLDRIEQNPEDFYTGTLAQQIVASVRAHGGVLSLKDLKEYQVKERTPVEADWKGYHIVSMPPPSSGGIHVIQILKMLENEPWDQSQFLKPASLNLMAQAMQQAFADRAKFLGDPDFVKVPAEGLLDDAYLKNLRAKLDPNHAKLASQVLAGEPRSDQHQDYKHQEHEHQDTSHLSLMDAEGNVVVSTQTINGYFGSALTAEGTGIVLNNEMDDFSAQIGAKNIFGATSTSLANSVEAKKTPLSSMSPTIVFKGSTPVLALGAPGGTRIITSVAQTILNYFVFHQDLYTSVSALRIHEQWLPDELFLENQDGDASLVRSLRGYGWKVKRVMAQSNVMAIAREGNDLVGVADPRDIGTSSGE